MKNFCPGRGVKKRVSGGSEKKIIPALVGSGINDLYLMHKIL
jgi:hypothetical protein